MAVVYKACEISHLLNWHLKLSAFKSIMPLPTPVDPHHVSLPLSAPTPTSINVLEIIGTWIENFNSLLDHMDVSKLSELFLQDCWWRDRLAVTLDLRTIHGLSKLAGYLEKNLRRSQIGHVEIRNNGAFPPSIQNPSPGLEWMQAMFDFQTAFGSGVGVVRLVLGAGGRWKAFAISTSLECLLGHKENIGLARPHGGSNSVDGGRENWLERRQRQAEFLIIGAGNNLRLQDRWGFSC
jgi:hypothetical protein